MRPSRVQARVEAVEAGELGSDVQAALDRALHEDPSGRLARYLARTQVPLDLLALVTLWVVLVPVLDLGNTHDLRGFGWQFRICLSIIYGIDITIRSRLAEHHLRYVRSHPVGLLAVPAPPVRVLFSLRLIRVLFRRGNLPRFLFAAVLLLLNGAIIVYLFERDAPGGNITSLGESVWWSIVTVTTVGYGDYFPITVQGQIVATLIMLIGIIAVAVLTAQVASTFVDQSSTTAKFGGAATDDDTDADADAEGAEAAELGEVEAVAVDLAEEAAAPSAAAAPPTTRADEAVAPPTAASLAELDARLSRIEQLLVALQPSAPPEGGDDSPAPSA